MAKPRRASALRSTRRPDADVMGALLTAFNRHPDYTPEGDEYCINLHAITFIFVRSRDKIGWSFEAHTENNYSTNDASDLAIAVREAKKAARSILLRDLEDLI